MPKITVREAAILTGKSRETINNATKDGTISFAQNERGVKVIDIAELERVYPLTKNIEDLEKDKTVRVSQSVSDSDSQEWKERYSEIKSRLEGIEREKTLIEDERRREREQFENQIDNLQSSLKIAQETSQKITLLLEDKNSDVNWERSIKALEQRISNQEKSAKEKEQREQKILHQNRALKKALDTEKNKSIWQRLFG